MYEYKCKIIKVVDGDTVDVDVDLGFGIWIHDERVRLYGIDTPETRTKDLTEKKFGLMAKSRVEELLPAGSFAVIRTELNKDSTELQEKFGRILGTFFIEQLNKTLNQVLIEEKLAVSYTGQNKASIRQLHEANWAALVSEGKAS